MNRPLLVTLLLAAPLALALAGAWLLPAPYGTQVLAFTLLAQGVSPAALQRNSPVPRFIRSHPLLGLISGGMMAAQFDNLFRADELWCAMAVIVTTMLASAGSQQASLLVRAGRSTTRVTPRLGRLREPEGL